MSFNVLGAYSDGSTFTVLFDDTPDLSTSTDPANYAFSGSFAISGTGTRSGSSVTFNASGGAADGTVYTVTVSNVISAVVPPEALTDASASFSLPVDVMPFTSTLGPVQDGAAPPEVQGPTFLGNQPAGAQTRYLMRGKVTATGQYVAWQVTGSPDSAGSQSGYPAGALSQIVIVEII